MSDNKNYYYLKLKDNFFDRPEIKAIESMQSGYEYICIMQKMYLRSLCRGGKLMLTDSIPYDIQMLSAVLGHKQETIKTAIEIFSKLGLCEILDDKSIYMLEIQKFIGKSSTEAERIRAYREKLRTVKQIECTNVQQMNDKSTPEIELEIELEKEIKIEKNERSIFPFNKLLKYWNETTGEHLLSFSPIVIQNITHFAKSYPYEKFAYVIDLKNKQWGKNPKMRSSLKPSTLFSETHFHEYATEIDIEQVQKQQEIDDQVRREKEILTANERRKEEEKLKTAQRLKDEENQRKANEIREKGIAEMTKDPDFLKKLLKQQVSSKKLAEVDNDR